MGKKWRHGQFVTCPRSQSKLIAILASCSLDPELAPFWGGLCPLKLRVFSHQHFAWVPAFEMLQWGGRMFLLWLLMSVGNSSWQIWNKMGTAPASFPRRWVESLLLTWEPGVEGEMAHCKAKLGIPGTKLQLVRSWGSCSTIHAWLSCCPFSKHAQGPALWQAMYKGCRACRGEPLHSSCQQRVSSLI